MADNDIDRINGYTSRDRMFARCQLCKRLLKRRTIKIHKCRIMPVKPTGTISIRKQILAGMQK